MAEPRILGLDGRPLRRAETATALSAPVASATLAGVRSPWLTESIASSLTPERLSSILRACDQGDAEAYLLLAEEMEMREPHYAGVIGVRKRAVCRLPVTVEAAGTDPADERLAEEVRTLVGQPGFAGMLFDAMDGVGKGYAAIEMAWDTTRRPWSVRDRLGPDGRRIRGYTWRDPRWFRYDRTSGTVLRLRATGAEPLAPMSASAVDADSLPLPPYRFIIHEPSVKSGLPLRNGLARLAVASYLCKSYTLRDWMAFAELYGLPIRVGKWGPGASEEDIAILLRALAGLGSDAAAGIPDSMSIEFVEAARGAGSGAEVFAVLAGWLDKQTSKAVLGQVGTTEGTPGALGSQSEMADVREDIRDADGRELAETITADLVAAYVSLNYGPVNLDELPRVWIGEPDQEDVAALADAAAKLIPLGVRVSEKGLRDRLNLPDPDPEDPEDVVRLRTATDAGAVAEAGAPASGGDAIADEDLNAYAMGIERLAGLMPIGEDYVRSRTGIPSPASGATVLVPPTRGQAPGEIAPAPAMQHAGGCCGPALNAAGTATTPGVVLDELAAEGLADWQRQMEPIINPVLALADEVAASGLPEDEAFEAFLDRLEGVMGRLDATTLIESLARATFRARGYGDARDV